MRYKIKFIHYKVWIPEVICLLLIYSSFLQYTGHLGDIAEYISLVCSALLWGWLFVEKKIKQREATFVLIMALYNVFFFAIGRGSLLVVISYLPVALFLLRREKIYSKIWSWIAVLIVLDILIAWGNSPNKYILYQGISRNYISVFTMFALAIHIVKCEKNQRKINLIWIIIAWIISIWAVGRGGIISTSILMILFVIQRSFEHEKNKNLFWVAKISLIIILLVIITIYVSNNLEYIQRTYLGRFFGVEASASSSTDYRVYMLTEYLRNCGESIKSFLLGANIRSVMLVGGNIHNSYLQTHFKFGIVGLLYVVIGSIKSVAYMFKNGKWQYLFIFIGLLIRAGTDWCFPGFPIDIFILYFIMYPGYDILNKKDELNETIRK